MERRKNSHRKTKHIQLFMSSAVPDLEKFDSSSMLQRTLGDGRVRAVGTILTPDGELVVEIGDTRFLRRELCAALGVTGQPAKRANPAPLGLCAFAATTFILSLCNAKALGVSVPHVVAGMGFWYGGIAQVIAGVFEMIYGSTFGAVAFISYGGFWLSYATILTKGFGIETAYEGKKDQLGYALGFYLLSWTVFSLMLSVLSVKSSISSFAMFVVLTFVFFFLMVGEFTVSELCKTIAGVLGIFTAILAWYNAFLSMVTTENSYFTIKPRMMPGKTV